MSAVEAIKQWFHEQWRASLDEVVRGRAKIWKAARWKLRDRYETGKCKGAEAPTGKKRRACYPHSLLRCFYSGSFVMLWDVFLGAHKHAYNFISCFFSTPLSSSPPLSPLLSLQNFRLYSKAGLFTSFRTASPSLGSGLGGNKKCSHRCWASRQSLTPGAHQQNLVYVSQAWSQKWEYKG